MGIIQAICISEVRGVQKHAIPEADLTPEWGIVGDAHGGNWHRQVSLLGLEKIEAFRAKGADVAYGAFGENLVVDGFDFRTLPVGSLLAVGDEDLINIHFHTNEPWKVLEYCATLGEIYDIVVEDMDRQARGLKG